MIPSPQEIDERLMQILARGSVNLGEQANIERLMLMMTRSCHLRCAYCFVQKTETGEVMTPGIARRSIDLLMKSNRSALEVQLFGGEPTAEWDLLIEVLDYTANHPERHDRPLTMLLTTNGLIDSADAWARLAQYPVKVLFSLDGDASTHRRFRPPHAGDDASWALTHETTWQQIIRTTQHLQVSELDWFMNAVVPPADADHLVQRYAWARANDIPALQLNYAVGMAWNPVQSEAFLRGLADVMRIDRDNPDRPLLYNWRSACEPVMLSDDLIVDVDGTVLHDGAIFLERALPKLKHTYRRGHLDDLEHFDPLRWSLATLFEVMVNTYPPDSVERAIVLQNTRMGAAVDLVIERIKKESG